MIRRSFATLGACKQGDRCRLVNRTQVGGSASTLHWEAGVVVEYAFALGEDTVCARPLVGTTDRAGMPRALPASTEVEVVGSRKRSAGASWRDSEHRANDSRGETIDPLARGSAAGELFNAKGGSQ